MNEYIEEVLLGLLRNSKQIKILGIDQESGRTSKKITIELEVSNNFGSTLINPLNETFANFSEGEPRPPVPMLE